MKGTLEEDVRPSLLIRPQSDRVMEKITVPFFLFLEKIGAGKSFAPLHVKDLAKAMKKAIVDTKPGVQTFSLLQIKKMIGM